MRPTKANVVCAVAIMCLSPIVSCGDDSTDEGGGSDGARVDLVDPQVIASRDGVLETTLTAEPAKVTVAGRSFESNVYNGSFVAPVIVVRRGDQVRLDLENRIDGAEIQIKGPEATNLHYHGFDISPNAPADDPFLHLDAGDTYEYRWDVPADHPQGTYWYHSHAHGHAEGQVLSGLSGMMVVDGLVEDHYPELADLTRRHLVLKDVALPGAKDEAALTKTINGQVGAAIRMRPGEWQVWEIGNVGANAFFDLASKGGLEFWVLARDGNLTNAPQAEPSLFLPAGSRATVAVRAADNGDHDLVSLKTDTGPQGDPNPEVSLAEVVIDGDAFDSEDGEEIEARMGEPPASVDTRTAAEVLAMPITNRRTVRFSETADGDTFYIDGKQFDPDVIDTVVPLGAVEEWTILNETGEKHVFHIHQTDFLVTSVNNDEQDALGLRDEIDLPITENGTPGTVKVIIPFTDPLMVGKFVYHCHILEHEDGGMMATIQVTGA